jgi:hypothetical protein
MMPIAVVAGRGGGGQPVGQIHFLERPDREPVAVTANAAGVLIAARADAGRPGRLRRPRLSAHLGLTPSAQGLTCTVTRDASARVR